MMRRGLAVLYSLVFLFIVSGCTLGNAMMIRRDAYGGVLALAGDKRDAMKDAEKQMAQHCRGPYGIIAEENVPVGQQTTRGDGNANEGAVVTVGSDPDATTTQEIYQHRVTYRCGSAAPAPPTTGGAASSSTVP